MTNYKVKSLPSGAGIIVTYKCTAACLHCCYCSSPRRSGRYMSRQVADKIFSLLKNMGCLSVHIGGGEPFVNFEKLLEVCRSAAERRVSIDYIETNASWCADEADVFDKLEKLMSAGVDCLLVSLDPFHNEFVPYAKIKKLLKCCKTAGMGVFPWQSKFGRIVGAMDENATHSLAEYEKVFGEGFIKSIAEGYGLGYNGRALKILEKITEDRKPCEYFAKEDSCRGAIASLNHFHVDMDENLIPPSCNGFRANIFELCESGLDCDKYRYFTAITEGGLGLLLDRAKTLGFSPKSEGYASKCALCFDIKKFVCGSANPPDIGPAGFFEEM